MPKSLVNIGYRPVLWNVMKYYAHWGVTDFILCLGYRGEAIKQYFLEDDECVSNDFVLTRSGRQVELLGRDIDRWRIAFVDTGVQASLGERLRAVESCLGDDTVFLANYTDVLSDLPLPQHLEHFQRQGAVASFACVRPTQTCHVVAVDDREQVRDLRHVRDTGLWINGGYFILSRRIFDYLKEHEDLVEEPFRRLIEERQLIAYRHEGFWACLDTFKDKQILDAMVAGGQTPWELWKGPGAPAQPQSPPVP